MAFHDLRSPAFYRRCLTSLCNVVFWATILLACVFRRVANSAPARCDYSRGSWVVDPTLPRYTGISCPFVRTSQNCALHKRTDTAYQKWRWVPAGCIPKRVSPLALSKAFQNKVVVLAGDSPSKNLATSISCLLHQGRAKMINSPVVVDGKVFPGARIPKFNIQFVSIFSSHINLRIAIPDSPREGRIDLDKFDTSVVSLLKIADIFIFQAVNWWTVPINQFFYKNKPLKVSNYLAYAIALGEFRKYLIRTKFTGIPVIISANPSHYNLPDNLALPIRCNVTRPLTPKQRLSFLARNGALMTLYNIQKKATAGSLIRFVDITTMSSYRPDGHIQGWGRIGGDNNSTGREDCLHWCESGVTDAWVEAIYNILG